MKIAAADIAPLSTVLSDSKIGSENRERKPAEPTIGKETVPNVEGDTAPSADQIRLGKLEVAHADRRAIAKQIRAVDKTMERIEDNVQSMQKILEGLIKVYPPYPPGSTERIEALRQFATLRKMIDQLTFPPADDSAAKILGDEKRFPEAGDWKITTPSARQEFTIGRQPVHAESGGLDLPDLPLDAPDGSLRQALDSLMGSRIALRRRREGFAADANRVVAAMR